MGKFTNFVLVVDVLNFYLACVVYGQYCHEIMGSYQGIGAAFNPAGVEFKARTAYAMRGVAIYEIVMGTFFMIALHKPQYQHMAFRVGFGWGIIIIFFLLHAVFGKPYSDGVAADMAQDFGTIGTIAALNGIAMCMVSPPDTTNTEPNHGSLMKPLLGFQAIFFWGAGLFYGINTLWALSLRGIGEGFAAGTFDEQAVAAVSFRALACYQATQGLICTLAYFDVTTRRFACIVTVVWGVATFYFLVMAYPKQYIDFSTQKELVTLSLYPDRFLQDFCEDMVFIGILTVANVVALYQSGSARQMGVKSD